MNQDGKWKRLIWIAIGLALFLSASDKFWEILARLPWIGELLSQHPKLAGWMKWAQWISGSIVTAWQALRFMQPSKKDIPEKTESDLLDQYNIERIPLEVGKSPKLVYLLPQEYADEGSARRVVAERLSRWKEKTSDVIFLYGSRSCGRRETVCRAIPADLYPLYQIRYESDGNEDFGKVVTTIRKFAEETGRAYVTFLIRCNRTLMANEMEELHKKSEKLQANLKVTLRLVFLCTCNETIRDSRIIGLAFQFETLNARESERFLQKASAMLAEKNDGVDAYALAQKRYSGRQLVAAENFARGNPAELIRFLETLAFQGESPNPLDAVQKEWQKRYRNLQLKEDSRRRILAVLHLLIAFYRAGEETIPLAEILEAVFGIGRGTSEEAEMKTALREILKLGEVSLAPFEFREVSLPDCFCDLFLASCGELPFHDEWQLVVDKLFTHEDLKNAGYAETYCRMMVESVIRCRLTEALPGARSPLLLYRMIDREILRVAFSGDEQTKRTANAWREQICSVLRERCAQAVTAFLADRLDILETGEVFHIIAQDLEGYAKDAGKWISRSLEHVLFLAEVEADPLSWWCIASDTSGTLYIRNYCQMLQGKIQEVLGDNQTPRQFIDNAWTLCWILLAYLNNRTTRPFVIDTFADWNAFFENAMSLMEPRCSPELKTLAEKVEASGKGESGSVLGSLLSLVPALDFLNRKGETFYLVFQILGLIDIRAGNQEEALADVIASLRDCAGRGEEYLPPALCRALRVKKFADAWQKVIRTLPEDPDAQDIERQFSLLQKRMDESSGLYKLDGEVIPSFFVNVAATVVALQDRYKENQSYQEAFRKSWEQINAAILARRYSFTDRDWFGFMKHIQYQTQFLSPEIREEYFSRWESALQKVQASESGVRKILSSELAMFLSTCSPVFHDPGWMNRSQTVIIDLAMKSKLPFYLNDEWKDVWMRTVMAQTVCSAPMLLFERITALVKTFGKSPPIPTQDAAPQKVTGPSGEETEVPDTLSEEVAAIRPEVRPEFESIVAWTLDYAQKGIAVTARSIPAEARKTYLIKSWGRVMSEFLLPYADSLLDRELSDPNANLVLEQFGKFLNAYRETCVQNGLADDYDLTFCLEEMNARVSRINGRWRKIGEENQVDHCDPQSLLSFLDDTEKKSGVLSAMAEAHEGMLFHLLKFNQSLLAADSTRDDEYLSKACEALPLLYRRIQELYGALTEDAKMRAGQQWYDELMKAFQECQAFGVICPDLYAETREYVKRKGRQ